MSLPPTTAPEPEAAAASAVVDLGPLGFDRGAHVLLDHALAPLTPGARLVVTGTDPALAVHLRVWARARGHEVDAGTSGEALVVLRGTATDDRWHGAIRAGDAASVTATQADARWGLAARGALVEAGGPAPRFDLDTHGVVWADIAPQLYARAVAGQWDPATAIPWTAAVELPTEVEAAVVQVMTYLIENEQAALTVPARFLGRVHPHFREIVQLLAVQVADEARHVEVFTRRALLRGDTLGVSGAGGRASLQSLLDEPDFTLALFLLSVLGEGSFLNLLAFLERHAPDPVTAAIARLVLQDEARHVAYGLAHLELAVRADPTLRDGLALAIQRRHDALRDTAGLNQAVDDALVVLAAGAWEPDAIATGFARVRVLETEMDEGRRRRLVRLGFDAADAAALSALHTRNFM
jgi:hypothetical protein